MKRSLCVLLALFVMILSAGAATAKTNVVQPNDDFYYYDGANVLKEDTEGEIVFSNDLLFEACGSQIVVAAIDTTGSTKIADYAADLMNEWGIGSEEKDNGFLLLMAIKDDDYYYIYRKGLTPLFERVDIYEIADKYLEPSFAKKDYDKGARLFFEEVYKAVADYYDLKITTADGVKAYKAWKAENAVPEQSSTQTQTGSQVPSRPAKTGNSSRSSGGSGIAILVVVVLIIILIASLGRRRRVNDGYTTGPVFFGRRRRVPPPPPPAPPPAPGPGFTPGRPMGPSRPSGSIFGSSSSHSRSSSWSSSSRSSSSRSSSSFGGGRSGGRSSSFSSRSSSSRSSGFGGGRSGGGGSRSRGFGGGGGRGRR